MEIFVMRHGKTVWNEKCITQGRMQNRLSKQGKIDAEKQALNFKDKKIDLIFASPLMRTMQTANIMNKYHGVKILKDDRIIEFGQGIFTGRSKKDLTPEEQAIKARRDKNYGLESYEEVFNRCKEFVKYLKENYSDKKILVVTHNVVATYLERLQTYKEFDAEIYVAKMGFANAELKKLRF